MFPRNSLYEMKLCRICVIFLMVEALLTMVDSMKVCEDIILLNGSKNC